MENELSPTTTGKSVTLLNVLLASHFTLLLKVWQFHWNVVGESFGAYHADLKTLYEDQVERVDDTAERIRTLNGNPIGNMVGMLGNTIIPEQNADMSVPQGIQMWQIIDTDYKSIISIIRHIHKSISHEDIATLNFLEDMIDKMEKQSWKINSYTKK